MPTLDLQNETMSGLFFDREERIKWEDYLTESLCSAHYRIAGQRVSPSLSREQFRPELDEFDFSAARPLSELLPWIIDRLERGAVQPTHPRYFGLFNPAPTFPAECAERIVAAFNPQLATASTSPIPVEIEAHVIRCVARRARFPAGSTGHFTTGGTEANHTALVCALTRANPAYAQDGMHAFPGQPTIYVSEDAHLAWHKIAHQVGLGRSAVRLVATDREGRMDMAALAAKVEADRSNDKIPVMIVATAGTTGAGMIDPLAGTAGIAAGARAWFHVDAAWGGALIASDRLRPLLSGIELADSATIDAHKWFATTMSCGMFMTRHAGVPSDSFHATTTYMPSNNLHLDPYVTTAQWSRRFLGLRLFLSLATVGWEGYAAHVERATRLAELLKEELIARDWTVVNDSPMAVVCAEPPDGCLPPAMIAKAVVASGQAWVSSARFRKRDVVRMCVTNGTTMPQDVRALASLLADLSRRRIG